jgi:hypothetical protein
MWSTEKQYCFRRQVDILIPLYLAIARAEKHLVSVNAYRDIGLATPTAFTTMPNALSVSTYSTIWIKDIYLQGNVQQK